MFNNLLPVHLNPVVRLTQEEEKRKRIAKPNPFKKRFVFKKSRLTHRQTTPEPQSVR